MKHFILAVSLCSCLGFSADEWSARAAKQVESLANDATFSQTMLDLTHPSGNSPKLKITADKSLDDGSVSAVITMTWNGAVLVNGYTTVTTWKFGKSGTISSLVTSDDAVISQSSAKARDMNQYFTDLFSDLFSGTRKVRKR